MFSGKAYSELAYSEQDHVPPDVNAAFTAFLAEVTSKRCWLLELETFALAKSDALSGVYSGQGFSELGFSDSLASAVTGGVVKQYFSTHGFTSKATDTPASSWYDGRLSEGVTVERFIAGRAGIGGLTRVVATIELDNTDGALDLLTRNYALDGRKATVLIGRATDARASFGTVFKGVVGKVTIGLQSVELALSDGIAKLAVRVNPNTYAGSGGLEGGNDLKGKPKPKCYGAVYNISPPLVDSANLIYQVHDGQIQDVPAVYDRGIALAKVASGPAGGQYSVQASQGTFTLGATPAGTVTADVQGEASGGYADKTGDILLRLLSLAGLTTDEIDTTSLQKLSNDAPASVGIWTDAEPRTVDQLIDELLWGVGAFGGFTRYGLFQAAVLSEPSGTEKASFTDEDIVSIERQPLPTPVEPAVWRTFVGWQRNYTLQTDLAAAVSAARRTFAAEQIRYAKSEDATIQSRHILARELVIDGYYANSADAVTESLRLFSLWSSNARATYQVKTRPKAMERDLGQVVQIKHARHGLANGMSARIIGHAMKGAEVTLTVLV